MRRMKPQAFVGRVRAAVIPQPIHTIQSFFTGHTATTKIPLLLPEKELLKNPDENAWFYSQNMVYVQEMKMMRMGEKNP